MRNKKLTIGAIVFYILILMASFISSAPTFTHVRALDTDSSYYTLISADSFAYRYQLEQDSTKLDSLATAVEGLDVAELQEEVDSTQDTIDVMYQDIADLGAWKDTVLLYMSLAPDSLKINKNMYVYGKVWIRDSIVVNTRVLFLPPADSSAVGNIILRQAGENLVFLNSCYLKSDGKYWKTDADAAASMPSRLVALGTISANGWGLFMKEGFLRCDALNLTIGGPIFPGLTPGELTQTQVSATGDQSQKVGVAESADVIDYDPDLTILEIK